MLKSCGSRRASLRACTQLGEEGEREEDPRGEATQGEGRLHRKPCGRRLLPPALEAALLAALSSFQDAK